MSSLPQYGDRYTAQYEDNSFETVLVGVRRRQVLRWLRKYRGRRILEAGCGLEPLFAHHQDFSTWQVVEPVAEFVSHAIDLAADDARIRVRAGRLEEQSRELAGEEFDFIVVSSLVHEVHDPLALLEAVRSICTADTVVHLNVPNALSFHRLLAVEMGLIADVFQPSDMDRAFGHRARFDSRKLNKLLLDAGFCVLESGTYFVKPFTHGQMDAILASGAFPPSLIDGLDRMTRYVPDHGCELYANVRRR